MTQKEIAELRRRFRPDKSAINHIYGCYVNGNREIISYLDEPLGIMPQEESEKYLSLLKKSLSGTQGKNLIDIVFSTQQVADSEEHRLLMALRDSQLKDGKARKAFYDRVIGTLDMDGGNYLLLMAYDAYDVPYKGKDGEMQADASDTVFSYVVCCICPVKDGKPELGFFAGENEFHSCTASQIVAPPELGFLFPAFDDRAANLYNALFYSKKPDQIHQEFIDAVFRTEPPMSAAEQRETFQSALCDALEESCSMEVVQSVHDSLRQRIQEHKDSRDPEPLAVTAKEIGAILLDCGVEEEKAAAFQEKCGQQFGGAALNPANLIDSKRFQVKTAEAEVQVDPDHSYLVEMRVIDGREYILIPADGGVEINGLPLNGAPGLRQEP